MATKKDKAPEAVTAAQEIISADTFGEYTAHVKKHLGMLDKYDANVGFQLGLRQAKESIDMLRAAGVLPGTPMSTVHPMLKLILKGLNKPDLQTGVDDVK